MQKTCHTNQANGPSFPWFYFLVILPRILYIIAKLGWYHKYILNDRSVRHIMFPPIMRSILENIWTENFQSHHEKLWNTKPITWVGKAEFAHLTYLEKKSIKDLKSLFYICSSFHALGSMNLVFLGRICRKVEMY